MKRKRGNKKGKSKKPPVVGVDDAAPSIDNLSTGDNSGLDDSDKDEFDSGMEAETPSSTGTDQPDKLASISSRGPIDKTPGNLVYGRVKVKIKTSKALDSQLTCSDAPTQSDTDKSSPQVGLEKLVVSEKMEDSANSLPEINRGVLGTQSKKAGSIKIKSRAFSSSSLSPCNNAGVTQGETIHQEFLRRDPQHNKQQLNAALEVIKKIMKMEAAEPFNVPVNPIALGIPDYFDVIDTPMDFGTICSNLENGVKYMNSADVLRDVQYIWENCFKYNNKGDYIVDLMKRVKKNFAKYWAAAGLYSEQTQGTESIQATDVAPSSHGKMPLKGGQLKHKTRKRHGVKRHKDDCLCAICVMMRRRQEREVNTQTAEDQIDTSDGLSAQEVKPEETSAAESGEDTSSSMDNSDQDADTGMEVKGDEVKVEDTEQPYSPMQEKPDGEEENENENGMTHQTKGEGEISEHSQLDDRTGDDRNRDHRTKMLESSGDIQSDTRKEAISMQHENETASADHQKPKESLDKTQKAKLYEHLRHFENPSILELCGTLFADNHESVWKGPHSLVQPKRSARTSSIHAAVATFMK